MGVSAVTSLSYWGGLQWSMSCEKAPGIQLLLTEKKKEIETEKLRKKTGLELTGHVQGRGSLSVDNITLKAMEH